MIYDNGKIRVDIVYTGDIFIKSSLTRLKTFAFTDEEGVKHGICLNALEYNKYIFFSK